MTIQEATHHYRVSEKTIRRWIQSGKLKADLIDGRWVVQEDRQHDQTSDQTVLIDQLRSEISHLRDQLVRRDEQLSHAHQLVAISQKSIQQLTEQNQLLLEDSRRHKLPLLRRIFRWT